MDGLGWREIGAEPELIAGEEIGDLGNGEGSAIAGDMNVDLGAGEIEARRVGVECGAEKKCGESSDAAGTKGSRGHHSVTGGRCFGIAERVPCRTMWASHGRKTRTDQFVTEDFSQGECPALIPKSESLLLVADAAGDAVSGDDAIANGDDAAGVLGDVGLVGDDDDGVAAWRGARRRGP